MKNSPPKTFDCVAFKREAADAVMRYRPACRGCLILGSRFPIRRFHRYRDFGLHASIQVLTPRTLCLSVFVVKKANYRPACRGTSF